MTSYLQAEGIENWRSNKLATMHIEPTKVERKYVSYDPVPLLRLEGQLISWKLKPLTTPSNAARGIIRYGTSLGIQWPLDSSLWDGKQPSPIESPIESRERERELSIILAISKTQVPGLTNPIVKGVASMWFWLPLATAPEHKVAEDDQMAQTCWQFRLRALLNK